ncbi:MAG TPA: gliding motility-associated C-terminal domain-containing protein, partial [Saprospiraceae bacterium]|nr:gliding motility-associated C-terminal domain-containing protein [Saprospiraceae bacterium]
DIYGCLKDSTVIVPGPPELLVELPGDTTILLGEEILIEVFTNSTDSLALAWNTSEYLSCADCLTPIASPLTTIRYSLVATDANGCKAADEMLLEVRRVIDVFFSNAIAPTAPTDFNARFEPSFGPAVARVTSLQIFDRWGTLIHEARNATPGDASLIWDGRYDGKVVMPGVYIWAIELELVDGATEKFRGDVTVVR